MTKTCLHCGKNFEAVQFWARYCSDSCRVKAYKKRKKTQAGKEGEKVTARP